MTASWVNACQYCVPEHTAQMTACAMPGDVVEALREGTPMPDTRLEALRTFAPRLVEARGHVAREELRAFLEAGFSHRKALEALVGLAATQLSNYANALAGTELDPGMEVFGWTHPDGRQP